MKTQLLSYLRSGLFALGVAVGMSAPAMAGPAGYVAPPVTSKAISDGTDATPVQFRRDGFRGRTWNEGRGWSRGRNWYRGRGGYGARGWHGGRGWYGRRHYGPSIGLSLSFPAYRYADPYLYDPYIYRAPRRVYRSYGLSGSHVAWCHDRWRSYRSWDNSYQPFNGPRRQCRSPFR